MIVANSRSMLASYTYSYIILVKTGITGFCSVYACMYDLMTSELIAIAVHACAMQNILV